MRRRRLRLHSSSDEDEQEDEQQQQQQAHQPQVVPATETLITPNQNPNPTATPVQHHHLPLDISDDDFLDVAENFSPPSMLNHTDSPIHDHLLKLGLKLRGEWLNSCISGLRNSVPGFESLNVSGKAKLCFQQFLSSDMNFSGGGILPPNVHALHLVDVPGPFVLQVDEIVNISYALRGRYQKAPAGLKRCLKLSMTDGVQRVFGMEYRPIKDLEVLASAGLKVVIHNVNIRRGLLMLVPEVLEVLGGAVEDLEAARQRLVHEVNKPPRGKRSRAGAVSSLASRATFSAWPPNNINSNGHTNRSMSHNRISLQSTDQGTSGIHTSERVAEGFTAPNPSPNAVPNQSTNAIPSPSTNAVPNPSANAFVGVEQMNTPRPSAVSNQSTHAVPNPSTNAFVGVEQMNTPRPIAVSNQSTSVEQMKTPRPNAVPDPSTNAFAGVEQINRNVATMAVSGVIREGIAEFLACPRDRPHATEETNMNDATMPISRDERELAGIFAIPSSSPNAEPNQFSDTALDAVDIDMIGEVEHPVLLTGNKEIPFTYLASLFAKWASQEDSIPYVQGKIKCLLTGVKGFQYRNRSRFELHVYVDDGSLISEVLIDHNVVHKILGYSPGEVNAALSSSDENAVRGMKGEMMQFQIFLANFEGIMLVEMNRRCGHPVALEMNQGCSTSDACSLLTRLKSVESAQQPIDLSP